MRGSLAAIAALTLLLATARGAAESVATSASEAKTAPDFVVLMLNQTREGAKTGVLASLGIHRYTRQHFDWREQELQQIVGRTDLYNPLLTPTVCPGTRATDACPKVRVIDDVKVPEAVAALQPARIVLLIPFAGYSRRDREFWATFIVQILKADGHRFNTFEIEYADQHCDVMCAETAFEAAARELAAMFRYMLEVDIGYRTGGVPAEWADASRLKSFTQWSNSCEETSQFDRIVRRYGERLWLSPFSWTPTRGIVYLKTVPWRGCNIFEVL